MVAGPNFPDVESWPANVRHLSHLAPDRHRAFYNEQRFTLNITCAEMAAMGYSPSVRLFEAGACGVPIISDTWRGWRRSLCPAMKSWSCVRPQRRQPSCYMPETERLALGACGPLPCLVATLPPTVCWSWRATLPASAGALSCRCSMRPKELAWGKPSQSSLRIFIDTTLWRVVV